jgi:hypothetical protein
MRPCQRLRAIRSPSPRLSVPAAFALTFLHGVAGIQHLRTISTSPYSEHTCARRQPQEFGKLLTTESSETRKIRSRL